MSSQVTKKTNVLLVMLGLLWCSIQQFYRVNNIIEIYANKKL